MTAALTNKQHLDDLLRHIHLGAEVYYVGQLCDSWRMEIPAVNAATFHLVCHGEAWVHMRDMAQPVKMCAGDIAFFAHDATHVISGLQTIPDEQACSSRSFSRSEPGTGLICGHLKLPAHIHRLLLALFPALILIHPDQDSVGRQMRSLIEMMTQEASENALGVTAVLDRLSDALFLCILRHTLHAMPHLSPLFAALTDDSLCLAVSDFIDHPAESWTVERMAKRACLSRSAFSARFTELVGMPPMEFVATWRMQLAADWLTKGNNSMMDVAMRCGYESEAAFRKAFKRITGTTPGQLRHG